MPMYCDSCGRELTLDEELNVTRLRQKRNRATCDRCRNPADWEWLQRQKQEETER